MYTLYVNIVKCVSARLYDGEFKLIAVADLEPTTTLRYIVVAPCVIANTSDSSKSVHYIET